MQQKVWKHKKLAHADYVHTLLRQLTNFNIVPNTGKIKIYKETKQSVCAGTIYYMQALGVKLHKEQWYKHERKPLKTINASKETIL
jgi:hypothetical protein